MILYTELTCDFDAAINKELQKEFNLSSNAVTEIYDYCLNLQIKGIRKISIDLTDKSNTHNIYIPTKISPMIYIYKSFDFDHYFAQDQMTRRKIVLETLHTAICEIPRVYPLDLEPFERAYRKVIELNYINKIVFGKLSTSKNKQFKAGIEIEVNEKEAVISTMFTDKEEKPIKRIELLRTLPHYMFIYRVIHAGKWINESEYMVSSRDGEINFKTSLQSDKSEIIFNPKNRSIDDLKTVLHEIEPYSQLSKVSLA